MNQEKLKQLQAQVRIGGKGTVRRKKKVVHRTATTDDKKLQSSLKKLSVNNIPGIEEVNMIKDDGTVIHFNNPKVQASLAANTFAVTGHAENKQITEMLPGILNQLGAESLTHLKRLATNVTGGAPSMDGPGSGAMDEEDDDEVPDLVENFDEVSKNETATEDAKISAVSDCCTPKGCGSAKTEPAAPAVVEVSPEPEQPEAVATEKAPVVESVDAPEVKVPETDAAPTEPLPEVVEVDAPAVKVPETDAAPAEPVPEVLEVDAPEVKVPETDSASTEPVPEGLKVDAAEVKVPETETALKEPIPEVVKEVSKESEECTAAATSVETVDAPEVIVPDITADAEPISEEVVEVASSEVTAPEAVVSSEPVSAEIVEDVKPTESIPAEEPVTDTVKAAEVTVPEVTTASTPVEVPETTTTAEPASSEPAKVAEAADNVTTSEE